MLTIFVINVSGFACRRPKEPTGSFIKSSTCVSLQLDGHQQIKILCPDFFGHGPELGAGQILPEMYPGKVVEDLGSDCRGDRDGGGGGHRVAVDLQVLRVSFEKCPRAGL